MAARDYDKHHANRVERNRAQVSSRAHRLVEVLFDLAVEFRSTQLEDLAIQADAAFLQTGQEPTEAEFKQILERAAGLLVK